MGEIISGILLLLAGSGVFMTGMKLMSDGLERSAGSGMRKLLNRISSNRFAGIGVGAAVTAIIQSSAATTVMVIGFVNAGLMTLFQATAIIMGANIGTTVTGILIAFSSFPIAEFAMALAFIGVLFMMFSKRDGVKRIGGILCGLGLIFVGLHLMSGALDVEPIKNAFSSMFSAIDFPLLLILIGTVFTALIQSSSAATGLIITLVSQNVLQTKLALFIVLGTNIGTCVTAIMAAMGASTNAKRTAFIHLLFNLIGTVIFTTFIWIFSNQVVRLLEFAVPLKSMQIAWFHVAFNLITTLLLAGFIKPLTRFAQFCIKGKKDDEEEIKLQFIDDRILHTPPIAVAQVIKEVNRMANIAKENLNLAMNALFNSDITQKEKIYKEEAKINFINKAVAQYLIKISSLSLPNADETLIGSLHHVISDIERIGDHAENFLEEAEEMVEHNVTFSEDAMGELKDMYDTVAKMFDCVMEVFQNRDVKRLEEVSKMEAVVDTMKILLGNNHIMRLNSGSCSVESGTHFYAVTSALERIADHLTNVAFSIKSPSGSQREAMAKIKREAAQRKSKKL